MRIGVVTDAHLCPPGTPPDAWHNPYDFAHAEANLVAALDLHRTGDSNVIAMLGDLSHLGDEPSLARGIALCGGGDRPVLAVPGNHDCGEVIDRLAMLSGRRGSASPRSLRPATSAGESLAGFRIVGLPIAVRHPDQGWLVEVPAVAAWDEEPVIVLSHFPVLSREAEARRAGLRYAGSSADRDGFGEALRRRVGPTLILHGHLHIRDAVAVGPVLQIGCAALIEPPHEVAVVDVEAAENGLTVRVRRRAVAPSPSVRLPLLTGESGAWTFRERAWAPIP